MTFLSSYAKVLVRAADKHSKQLNKGEYNMITHNEMIKILDDHGITPRDQAHPELTADTSFYDVCGEYDSYETIDVLTYLGY